MKYLHNYGVINELIVKNVFLYIKLVNKQILTKQ